jgi:hypothetical protein
MLDGLELLLLSLGESLLNLDFPVNLLHGCLRGRGLQWRIGLRRRCLGFQRTPFLVE